MNDHSARHRGREQHPARLQVALFATCLVDVFRPSVAFNTLTLLERAGCDVSVPAAQTCCGQPGFNSGQYDSAALAAQAFINTFEPFDYIVAPSGSCTSMVSLHYPGLLSGTWRARAEALAEKTFELTTFLTDIARLPDGGSTQQHCGVALTYHDSCAGLRELGIEAQPRRLLKSHCQMTPIELDDGQVCCGFGGTFCAKMPAIATAMTDDKLQSIAATGAPLLAGGDLGCLLAIKGRASRLGQAIEVRHIAELLAGADDIPAIGEPHS